MGAGSYFTDEFGDGGDDYKYSYDRNGNEVTTHPWFGFDKNAAGTYADQTASEAAGASDRQKLLDQASGINQNASLIGDSATRIGQSAQTMHATETGLTGLSNDLGNAPSAAALAAKSAQQSNNSLAMSQAASARGANSALMMREAMANNDARGRAASSDAATAAANEQASRFATRGQLLASAGGVQNNMANAYGSQASALGTAANAQGTAGGLVNNSRTADIAQRGQDLTANQNANQMTQQHDDAMYAALAAKHAKADADSGSTLDSALSVLSDIRLKTDVDPLPTSSGSSDSKSEDKDKKKDDSSSDTSGMMSGLMAAYGGGGGGGAMLSDERSKSSRKKLDENSMGSELERLLSQATKQGGDRLDTSDVNRRYDRSALDSAQLGEGSRIYGASSARTAPPTARFADYQPPTARFADAPPAAAPARAPARDSGFDVAALDDAYRRERDPSSYMMSDEDTKTDRRKLLDMATKPSANEKNLDEIEGYSFRYKPGVAARIGEDTAKRPGIMAQDLEKAPAGKQVVSDTEEGKALDIPRALGFSLAGVAGLDKRLQRLEAASGGRKKSKAA
jgi:hypothetical protein